MTTPQAVVGKTKDVGFEIGVRRTFDASLQHAWDVLTSAEGLRTWLGDVGSLPPEKGSQFQTGDGAYGEMRVFRPGSHLRLTWQPGGWPRPSTIQVRVMPSGAKTAISFHQEHLPGAKERGEMRQRWEEALDTLESLL